MWQSVEISTKKENEGMTGGNKRRMMKMLRVSLRKKEHEGWPRETGAGFIKADVRSMRPVGNNAIRFYLFDKPPYGHDQTIPVDELNRRETEEAIKALRRMKA
jgi:hypothetical protein